MSGRTGAAIQDESYLIHIFSACETKTNNKLIWSDINSSFTLILQPFLQIQKHIHYSIFIIDINDSAIYIIFWVKERHKHTRWISNCYPLMKQHKINLNRQKANHIHHVGMFITTTDVSKHFLFKFLTMETRTVFYIPI